MKRITALAVIFVSMTALLGTAQAAKGQTGFDMAGMFRPMNGQEEKSFKTRLDLTDDQLAKLKTINQDYRKDVQALSRKYRTAREDLVNALKSADPHSRNIARKMGDVHRAQSNLVDKEVEYWSRVSAVLTPQQEDEFWRMFAGNRLKGGGGSADAAPQGGSGKYDMEDSGDN